MQNEFGMGWYGEKTDTENGSWGPAFDGSTLKYGNVYDNSQNLKSYLPIENNVKDFFDTGLRYNNSVSFNGATDQSNFFADSRRWYHSYGCRQLYKIHILRTCITQNQECDS